MYTDTHIYIIYTFTHISIDGCFVVYSFAWFGMLMIGWGVGNCVFNGVGSRSRNR